MKMTKYSGNPILSPNPANEWESLVATNPGAWFDDETGEFILIYRAAGNDKAHRISLGLAKSRDGIHFERCSDEPFLKTSEEGHYDGGSVEDPRIVRIGEWYYITYACVPFLPGRYWENQENGRTVDLGFPQEAPWILRTNNTATGLLMTRDLKTLYRVGYITDRTVDDRDVMLFPELIQGRFWTLHRPSGWTGPAYGPEKASIWIGSCADLLEHKDLKLLAEPRKGLDWEHYKIGANAPPIRTSKGWLTLYHGVGKDARYRVGALLLDLNDPSIVLHRTPEPILEPEFPFECEGIYKGICFPCGNVVVDGTLYVYYGGADQYVGLATCKLDELVEHVARFAAE